MAMLSCGIRSQHGEEHGGVECDGDLVRLWFMELMQGATKFSVGRDQGWASPAGREHTGPRSGRDAQQRSELDR